MKVQKATNVSKPKNGEGVENEREVLEVRYCKIHLLPLTISQERDLGVVRDLHKG